MNSYTQIAASTDSELLLETMDVCIDVMKTEIEANLTDETAFQLLFAASSPGATKPKELLLHVMTALIALAAAMTSVAAASAEEEQR
jgi:hypothetical protein